MTKAEALREVGISRARVRAVTWAVVFGCCLATVAIERWRDALSVWLAASLYMGLLLGGTWAVRRVAFAFGKTCETHGRFLAWREMREMREASGEAIK